MPPATLEAVKTYRPVDFAAEFSTLLVVRLPGRAGVVHWEPVPVQDFLWEVIASGFRTVPDDHWEHYIYLNEPTRVRHPLKPVDMLWAPGVPSHHR